MHNGQKKLKAFTLLELIVAMAIIAVLIGLSVVGINTVQRSTRDTERLSAMNDLVLEIESYYGVNGAYPSLTVAGNVFTIGGAGGRTVTVDGGATVNLAGTTATGTDYCYDLGTSGASYSIGVSLENKTAGEFRKSGPTVADCSLTASTTAL